MKFSDIVFLKPNMPQHAKSTSFPATADIFLLSEAEFKNMPDIITIVGDNDSMAIVDKELLTYIRSLCQSDHLGMILENAPVGVVAIDTNSRIFYANEAYSSILGIPKQRVLGQYMCDIEPNAVILEVLDGHPKVMNRTVWVNSVKRQVRVSISPLFKNKKLWGAVSFFSDITETVALTGELKKVRGLAEHFRTELENERALPKGFADIIGYNPKFVTILQTASIVAQTEASLLIQGEHGSGKEVLARAVHKASPRHKRPFITINCAAIPEALLESELFGYEEGSFTGAKKGGSLGKFELADGGVLFLDEVGDMPTAMQAKLLRALQEKEIEKIGRKKTISLDVRIIAATNRNLEKLVESGNFRPDLFYRLNVISLTIPPLRDRTDDIIPLAEDLIKKFNKKYNKTVVLSQPICSVLQRHSWPGNVRELANVLEHAVIMCSQSLLLPEHLPDRFSGKPTIDLSEYTTYNWHDNIQKIEKQLLQSAMEKSKGNRSEAIRSLGLSRKTFYDKLKKYDL